MGKISLTIDNGPDPVVTPEVLDVLAEKSVTATFFLVGERVAEAGGMALVERIAAAGHHIGNHSWSHDVQFGTTPTDAAVREEVVRTAELLAP
ncbi:MAG: polysaccharide deacetylase family protein, partial [Pseudomonadales bacterium]